MELIESSKIEHKEDTKVITISSQYLDVSSEFKEALKIIEAYGLDSIVGNKRELEMMQSNGNIINLEINLTKVNQ